MLSQSPPTSCPSLTIDPCSQHIPTCILMQSLSCHSLWTITLLLVASSYARSSSPRINNAQTTPFTPMTKRHATQGSLIDLFYTCLALWLCNAGMHFDPHLYYSEVRVSFPDSMCYDCVAGVGSLLTQK